ncbi:MAG TPA: hypothetical protein DDZ89_18970 [Clostridiales bacterium]|nr:hypothetical protein [Clostridiales bacterium]
MIRSISNKQYLTIIDRNDQNHYGCNQEWFGTKWQRLAGCGPSVASNIFGYLYKRNGYRNTNEFYTKSEFVTLMEEIWKHVTPTVRGVNTTKIFYKGLVSYAEIKNLNLSYRFLDIITDKHEKPSLSDITTFIAEGLEKDTPVAFLNLCNGKEKNLDKWHWVTVVSMICTDDLSKVILEIFDEGLIKQVDLKLWCETTTLGGGLVYACI